MPKPPAGPWFNEIAAFMRRTYWAPDTGRVMAFTTGTDQEIEFLVDALGLAPPCRVLDVGCGPGRHSLALARRGFAVVGVDLSPDFVDLARGSAAREGLDVRFDVLDVRDLAFDAEFDAVVCLCQGGFGLLGGDEDAAVIDRIAAAARPGGAIALSAFSAYFALRFLDDGETFDPRTGVLHESATVRDDAGEERAFDLWTTCFTARELTLLLAAAALVVEGLHSVAPGAYAPRPADLEHPELLALARKPPGL